VNVAGRAVDAEPARAKRVEIRTPRHKGHVGARGGKPATEIAAYPSGAHDGDTHPAHRTRIEFERKERVASDARSSDRSHMKSIAHADAARNPNDQARWQAVLARARHADGLFVYGVKSTGVYCRPSCASRRPGRDRVTFFETPLGAEKAGYRACRRCRPHLAASDSWLEKIRTACVYLASVDGHVSLTSLADRLGGSPYHLQRNFKRIVGVTPREYAEACRLRKVKSRLREGGAITEALFDAGYGSTSRFYERAAPKLGMSPSSYRRGGKGMEIRYAVVASPLGRLLVAATTKGVCAIAIGASDADLERALADEYPSANRVKDERAAARWSAAIVAHVAGRRPRLDLPLDVQATAFQWQVWQALGAIPRGETRTYTEVAAAIGRPRAVRAVARACATNPVAIAIPCHRVVPAAGGVGGYRWGVARKKQLLDREQRGEK
jgi:AraC family transcriptional regulator of adaptative response/methylated-DNA-[protein]-cysteine methyltransferase